MPTGYTRELYDGKPITKRDFILKCARAFGAAVLLRDDNSNEPLTKADIERCVEDLSHEEERLKTAQEGAKLTDEEILSGFDPYINKELAYHQKAIKKEQDIYQRYKFMLDQIQDWEPPTGDHVELKAFMIQQLNESIKFDCEGDHHQEAILRLKKINKEDYLKDKREVLDRSLQLAEVSLNDTMKRNKQRRKWLEDLIEDLQGSGL